MPFDLQKDILLGKGWTKVINVQDMLCRVHDSTSTFNLALIFFFHLNFTFVLGNSCCQGFFVSPFPIYASNTQHVQRHPFARLFSAWNQKFKRNNDRWRDFIDVKIEHFETVNNRSGSSHLNSFDAFLKHIAATKRSKDFNVHWSSIYRSCRPCSIDYRALIKKVLLHLCVG